MTSPLKSKSLDAPDLFCTPSRTAGLLKGRKARRDPVAKENVGTPVQELQRSPRPQCITPLISDLMSNLQASNIRLSGKTVSPSLAMLRMTPGPTLQERQKLLQEKHQKAKQSVDTLAVGGGVSLWPEMDSMRLSAKEGVILSVSCMAVTLSACLLFKCLHGSLLHSIQQYTATVDQFSAAHPVTHFSQSALNGSLLAWHTHFLQLLDEIKKQFETELLQAHTAYLLYLLLYISAVSTLLYYLADNMIKKSKLTPRRIKVWVLLLVATASWTFLMMRLLVSYRRLEQGVEETVRKLLDKLAHLATVNLDLNMYHNVAAYWKERCLPPLSRGTLSVFGMVPVREVFYYLHYYSVPVLTALCTPILQLLLALKEMYMGPVRIKQSRSMAQG
ncbi:hypothetical protein GN956_G16865 [Arapaima gigas]